MNKLDTLWTREQAVRSLLRIVEEADKHSEVLAAVRELNSLYGYNTASLLEDTKQTPVLNLKFVDKNNDGK